MSDTAKQFSLQGFRPDGFGYPTGLNSITANTVVDYLVIAGGGGANLGVHYNGGNGGRGVVIISYAGPQQWTGGTYSSSGGNSIHTYTGEGAFTFAANNTSKFVIN